MKKTIFLVFASILSLNALHAQKYFGKSYPATKTVDEYYDSSDVKKSYTVMGKAELKKGFRSLEKAQQKIIKVIMAILAIMGIKAITGIKVVRRSQHEAR